MRRYFSCSTCVSTPYGEVAVGIMRIGLPPTFLTGVPWAAAWTILRSGEAFLKAWARMMASCDALIDALIGEAANGSLFMTSIGGSTLVTRVALLEE